MGDRANCIVLQNTFSDEAPPVWLYTHWHGAELLTAVQTAIRRRQRWDDDSYLTRIIFDEMTKGQQGRETGFGISTTEVDNSHNYVVVDPSKPEVRIESMSDRSVLQRWSFEDFCSAEVGEDY